MSAEDPLVPALMQALSEAPGGLSLPRLCKRLDVRMSVLLRTLAWLGDTPIGGRATAGWVRVEGRGERWVAILNAAGRAALDLTSHDPTSHDPTRSA